MKNEIANQSTLLQFLMARQDHVHGAETVKEFLNETSDFALLGMTYAEFNNAKDALIAAGTIILKTINDKLFVVVDDSFAVAA